MKQFATKSKKVCLIGISVLLTLLLHVSVSHAQSDNWTQKTDMPTARFNTSSCTLDGKFYVFGGDSSTSWEGPAIGTVEVYDPALDSWDVTKADMPTKRVEFCASLVNGKIYIIGGAQRHGGSPLGTVEEYDPVTDTWDTAKLPMPTPRTFAAYGVIDNKIYVAGGTRNSSYNPSNILEIYDPATDTWDATKIGMWKSVYAPRGAVIDDKFYVTGGLIGSPWVGQKDVQLYDPATDEWTIKTAMPHGRVGHTANVVGGKLYVIGGDSRNIKVTQVEEYDPDSNSWTEVDQIPDLRTLVVHSACELGEEIFVFGGSTSASYPGRVPTSAVYSYQPPAPAQNSNWTQKADIPTARWVAASCELDGKIYVIGGAKTWNSSLNTVEVYDPATDTWDTTKADMPTARALLCVAAVNGKIYAIGGTPSLDGDTILGVVEEYNPVTDSWDTNKQPMPTAREAVACGVINNMIYVAGGSFLTSSTISDKLEVYDPATDNWTSKANMLSGRIAGGGIMGAVLNDTFYVSGGFIGSPWIGQKAVQKYDPTTDNWEFGPNLIHGRAGNTTNVVDGKIYAIGGDRQPPVVEEVEEYDPQAETWTVIDTIPSVMIGHTSSVYSNEIYLFSGSTTNVHSLTLTNKVYSYIPAPVTSIESQKNLTPDVFVLHQNYPNPFNPATTIQYSIPVVAAPSVVEGLNQNSSELRLVTLKVYNILGKEVATLVNEHQRPGYYEVKWDASALTSGVYFYHLNAGKFNETRKMVLLR